MIVECPQCHLRYDVSGRPAGTWARCRCGMSFQLPRPPETAGMLNCPQCGAPCPPLCTHCDYCNTTLATVACPRCFGLLFAGYKHCVHCGAAIDQPARVYGAGEAQPLRCPRCASDGRAANLFAHLVGGDTLLDQCPACAGMWLDRDAFERLVAARRQESTVPLPGATSSPPPASVDTKVVYLYCPECGEMMTRQNFGKCSGVIIDSCRSHGIWFDRDELRRIVEFVARGGLEESMRREAAELGRQIESRRTTLEMKAAESTPFQQHSSAGSTGYALAGLIGKLLERLLR
ncbi:MAG: zf-TFIIB domain-containing protein [Pseudomonadota bacterium]